MNLFKNLPMLATLALGCWLTAAEAADESSPASTAAAENAQTNPTAPSVEPFTFKGGTLDEFIDALDKRFHVKVRERATITVPLQTMVPKMRLGPPCSERNIMGMYNDLSAHGFPELGLWYWTGEFSNGLPGVLTLSGSSTNSLNSVKLRAFSMKGLSEEQRRNVMEAIGEAVSILQGAQQRNGSSQLAGGGLRFSPATELLLVWGSEPFLDAAEAVVKEYRQTQPAKF
jgi:hypothetical protein